MRFTFSLEAILLFIQQLCVMPLYSQKDSVTISHLYITDISCDTCKNQAQNLIITTQPCIPTLFLAVK